MARVIVIFEDKPGGTVIQVSSDPPLRVIDDPVHGKVPDVTDSAALASAFGAVMEVAGLAATFEVFKLNEAIL